MKLSDRQWYYLLMNFEVLFWQFSIIRVAGTLHCIKRLLHYCIKRWFPSTVGLYPIPFIYREGRCFYRRRSRKIIMSLWQSVTQSVTQSVRVGTSEKMIFWFGDRGSHTVFYLMNFYLGREDQLILCPQRDGEEEQWSCYHYRLHKPGWAILFNQHAIWSLAFSLTPSTS